MTDLDAAWWAKLRRASTHRGTLRGLADEFQASEPYTLNPEPGERPNEVAYRLRIRREAPAEISTVVGDVLHNLRSALDSLAYELAVPPNDAALTKRESEVTYFPWFPSLRAYEAFFGLGDEPTEASRLRGRIYGPEARKAMQAAQPFWWTELATNMSTSKRQQLSDEDFRWSAIYRLQKLNNIDKHRRLPALGVGWPEMFYWGSDEGDDTRFRPGHIPPTDDTILCYLVGPNAANIELQTEFALVLTDDPRHEPGKDNHYQPEDCQKLLASLAQQVEMTVWRVLNEYAAHTGRR